MGKHSSLINRLADYPPVVLDGVEFTGPYLSVMLRVNPQRLEEEAARTPRLIAEFGRLVARAHRVKQHAEMEYRRWREQTAFRLCNNMDAAVHAGFACAANPGVDAKGKAKPAKLPAASAVDGYLRTTDSYEQHHARMHAAEETWGTLHAALEAARARTWVVRVWETNNPTDEIPSQYREPATHPGMDPPRSTGKPPPPPVIPGD